MRVKQYISARGDAVPAGVTIYDENGKNKTVFINDIERIEPPGEDHENRNKEIREQIKKVNFDLHDMREKLARAQTRVRLDKLDKNPDTEGKAELKRHQDEVKNINAEIKKLKTKGYSLLNAVYQIIVRNR